MEGPKLYKLRNGLTLICQQKKSSIVSLGLFVNAGSNADIIPGTAHFLEHLIFRNIQEDKFIKKIGCIVNAYTTRFYTCYNFIVVNRYINNCLTTFLKKISDIKFNCEVIKRELEIIEKEIEYSKQKNNEFKIKIMKSLYNELENNICGNNNSIKLIDEKVLRNFYVKYYNSSNICVSVIGKFESCLNLIEKFNFTIGDCFNQEFRYVINQNPKDDLNLSLSKTSFYYCKAWPVVCTNIKKKIVFQIIASIIAGGMNSDMYRMARDNGIAYLVGSQFISALCYDYMSFYSQISKTNMRKLKDVLNYVFQKRYENGFKEQELVREKNILRIQHAQMNESSYTMMEYNYLNVKKYGELEDFEQVISSINVEDVYDTFVNCIYKNISIEFII